MNDQELLEYELANAKKQFKRLKEREREALRKYLAYCIEQKPKWSEADYKHHIEKCSFAVMQDQNQQAKEWESKQKGFQQ